MKYILLFLILGLSTLVFADDKVLIDTIKDLREKTLPDNNTYKKEIDGTYDSMKKRIVVPEVKIPAYDIFKDDQAKILKSFNLPEAKDIIPGVDNESGCYDKQRLGDYKVFIFISSGVPMVTLSQFMQDALKLRDVLLVLRGVIGEADFLKPTQDFITQISCGKKMQDIKNASDCNTSRVDINPILFSLFGIEQVPAVVYSKLDYQELMIRANLNLPLKDDEYFIIRGDMELSYALEKFENAGADSGNYLKTLRGNY